MSSKLIKYIKYKTEETFGGIWIEDRQEFAKFVSAVNTNAFEDNNEGIVFTDNYFYMYYRSIDGRLIPFFSAYMNEYESQDIVNTVNEWWNNESKRNIRAWANWFNERPWNIKSKNDGVSGADKDLSVARDDSRLGSQLFRKGRYFDTPELYSKVKRADRGEGKVDYSLREATGEKLTPAMIRHHMMENVTRQQE